MKLTEHFHVIKHSTTLNCQLNTISHSVSCELTTQLQVLTRTCNEVCINHIEASCLLLQDTVELTNTHLTGQSNELTLVSTDNVVAEIEQVILEQLCSQLCIITYVSWSNLLEQTCRDWNETTISTLQIVSTICITVRVSEQQLLLLSLLPLTKSLPILIVRPQIRLLTCLRISQSDSQYCRVSITSDIVSKTHSHQAITHLKWSLIVDDICLITVLLVCRTDTVYLTAWEQILTRDIRTLEAFCYIALIYPCATILVWSTVYTYLEVYVVKCKNCTWTEPLLFKTKINRSIINTWSQTFCN